MKEPLVCFTARINQSTNNKLEQILVKEKFIRSKNQLVEEALNAFIEAWRKEQPENIAQEEPKATKSRKK